MKNLPHGLWPVMLTPFKLNNEIDYDGLQQLTEFYIAAGADGLFANCLSSEMFQLTDDEKVAVTRFVVETVNGRIPVITTGTFSAAHNDNRDLINRLYDTGVHAVVVNTNQIVSLGEGENRFKTAIERLLNETPDVPLGIYECPVPYKRVLSADEMKWLAQTNRFLYMKDTTCDLNKINAKLEAVKGTSLGLYNANTPTGWDSLLNGAQGLSPIAANFYPELYRYLIQQWKDGAANEKIRDLNAALSIMDTQIHQLYPWSAKWFLQKRGLNISTQTRVSGQEPEYQDYVKFDALMDLFLNQLQQLGVSKVEI